MEIIKTKYEKGKIIKINFGNDLDEKSKKISGSIELDIENQGQFLEHINTIFDEGISLVIVEMQNINYIDSSGLWALFETHKKASQRNGKIVLLNPKKDVKRVLDITKMSSKISILDNDKSAIKYLLE